MKLLRVGHTRGFYRPGRSPLGTAAWPWVVCAASASGDPDLGTEGAHTCTGGSSGWGCGAPACRALRIQLEHTWSSNPQNGGVGAADEAGGGTPALWGFAPPTPRIKRCVSCRLRFCVMGAVTLQATGFGITLPAPLKDGEVMERPGGWAEHP